MADRRSYGTGSLYSRTDASGRETWYGRWHASGRRVKRRVGLKRQDGTRDGLTRPQAEAELRKLIADTAEAGAPVTWRIDIADLADRYARHLEATGRKRSTVTAVRSAQNVWIVPILGTLSVDRVKPEDVEDLMRTMRGKGVGPKSIRNYIGTLSAMYRYALHPRRRWATENPCAAVDLPPVADSTEVHFLTVEEVDTLASAACEGRYQQIDRALYVTAAMTGLRQGELIALRWQDVDWRAQRIRVRRNHVLGEFGTPKSRRSTRSVPMSTRVAGELDRLSQAAQGAAGREPDPDALVFGEPASGAPLRRPALMERYRRALKAAQLEPAHRFHDLRHTFGTAMAAAGVPMRTLQEWMGHRDLATTQRYADYAPNAREAEMVEAAFSTEGLRKPVPQRP